MSEPTRTKLEPTLTALRERAVVLRQGRWSDGPEDAELMEHAADAIEGLEAEIAELRKLLLSIWNDACQFDDFWDYVHDDGTLYREDELPHYQDRMRELGVEVDG